MSLLKENIIETDGKKIKRSKKKKDKRMLEEASKAEESGSLDGNILGEEKGLDVDDGREESKKKNKKKKSLRENTGQGTSNTVHEEVVKGDTNESNASSHGREEDDQNIEHEENESAHHVNLLGDPNSQPDHKTFANKEKKMKRLMEQTAKAKNRGICYLSRIPPRMDHVKLRQILSQYGEIERIYLAPENPAAQVKRKCAGGFRGQEFAEGWVEFAKKNVAKRTANMLNGEQIGGRKRSPWYYDLWSIKYLSKFKWDDLTEEFAYKSAVREQKLALELSAAKRERNLYQSMVDQSRALAAIEERLKKKQKLEQDSGENSEQPASVLVPKVIRHFPQKQPVTQNETEKKSRLSNEVLAGVFGTA